MFIVNKTIKGKTVQTSVRDATPFDIWIDAT